MTDGPFKHADLPNRWKKYGEDLESDAKTSSQRTERVESAILRDLCTKETRALVLEIDSYVKRLQQDIVPRVGIEAIFNKYPQTPQTDNLRRILTAHLVTASSVESAWQFGFDKWVRNEAFRTRNRMVEHCISARDRGDLKGVDFPKVVERNDDAFAGINYDKIRDRFFSGKGAAKFAMAKQDGLGDGPG